MRLPVLAFLLLSIYTHAQTLVRGGLQGDKVLIMTPKGLSAETIATSR